MKVIKSGARVKKLRIRKARVLHGMPTVGKSSLLARLNAASMMGVDSDVIVQVLYSLANGNARYRAGDVFPNGIRKSFWQWNDEWRGKPEDSVLTGLKLGAAQLGAEWAQAGGIVLTNLRRESMLSGAPIDVSFGVPGPIATERSAIRAARAKKADMTGFPIALSTKWHRHWLEWVKETDLPAYELEDGEYLDEVIDLDFTAKVAVPKGKLWEAIMDVQSIIDEDTRSKLAAAKA